MNRNQSAPRYAADLLGEMAHRVLSPGSTGTVLAGYSRAVYLRSERDDVVWLASGDVSLHRRGLRVRGRLPRPQPDSTYRVSHGMLLLDSSAPIELSEASIWKAPRLFGSSEPLAMPVSLWDPLRMLPPPAGFGALLPSLLGFAAGTPFPDRPPGQERALIAAYPSICGVAKACQRKDFDALLQHAGDLVGLGEGLTPSGDDYVGGVLFGLAMLQEADALRQWCSPEALARFIEASTARTNRISGALLGDHSAGHAAESLHRFAFACLVDRSERGACRAAGELIQMGQSTGWDLLTGAWTAMALVPCTPRATHGRAGALATAERT